MKVLILGGDGMLGHQLLKSWSKKFDVRVTMKDDQPLANPEGLFTEKNTFFGVNALDDYSLLKVILDFKPEVIVNGLGVIKQRPKAHDRVLALQLNSLLPHRLAMVTKDLGARLINFSTDCVFSGDKGGYTESDVPDSDDTYGQTKRMGEIIGEEHCLTLRTSFFGLELKYFTGLIEWFLHSKGVIKGHTKAIYSGLSTLEMARIVDEIITRHPGLNGLYHVSSEPINKYELLTSLKQKLDRGDIQIEEDSAVRINRSLDSNRFRDVTGYRPPTWDKMLTELAETIRSRKTT